MGENENMIEPSTKTKTNTGYTLAKSTHEYMKVYFT